MSAAPLSLAEDKYDNSIVPFPPFDHTVLVELPTATADNHSKIAAQTTTTQSRGSPSFDPFASGKGYPEFSPCCLKVVRGFPVQNDNLPSGPMSVRCFPPPSNAAYEKALRAHYVKRWEDGDGSAEAETAHQRRLRVQRMRIVVVPQDGYFTEVRQVDTSENWRPEGSSSLGEGEGFGGKEREESSEYMEGVGLGIESGLGSGGPSGSGEDEEDVGVGELQGEEMEKVQEFEETVAMREAQVAGQAEQIRLHEQREDEDTGESEDEGLFMNDEMSKGERLARNIDFRRDGWNMIAPGVSGDILSAEEQREDFIEDINNNGEQLEFCTVCKTAHIPPGPPITLADRDTCGSQLPKWFPAHLVPRPWDTYRRLINELVALEEKAQERRARAQDPHKPSWDLEWHEADAELAAAGRREGWWRCRGGPEAPAVERKCQVCHRTKGRGEQALTVGEEDEMREERKTLLQGFIDRQVKLFGEMDREIALSKIQLENLGLMEKPAEMQQQAMASDTKEALEAMTREVEETVNKDLKEILRPWRRAWNGDDATEPEESSASSSEEEDSEKETPESTSATFCF